MHWGTYRSTTSPTPMTELMRRLIESETSKPANFSRAQPQWRANLHRCSLCNNETTVGVCSVYLYINRSCITGEYWSCVGPSRPLQGSVRVVVKYFRDTMRGTRHSHSITPLRSSVSTIFLVIFCAPVTLGSLTDRTSVLSRPVVLCLSARLLTFPAG